jgi:glycosyltransferase involved in cell wall biosynthesis
MGFKQGEEPLVSIVIPAYNAAQYLREAIDSVLNQTYSNIELIVLDDGSTDATRDILGSYSQGSLYWESHANMGQSATLNKGWAMAKGSILSYLSADDSLLPKAVQISVESLLGDESVIMTYGDYMLMDENSNDIRRVCAPEFNYQQMVSDIIVQPGPGVFFYKTAFEKIGGWNPSYRQVPDLEYWLRLGLQGDFFRIPVVLAKFRVHDESQTYMKASVEKSEECVHVIENYFKMKVLPSKVRVLERQSKASAHLFTARMHLRAGRYLVAVNHLKEVLCLRPAALLSKHAVRMIGNALLFRLKQRAN